MRKVANVKTNRYAPVPIPKKGTLFSLDGMAFTVTEVNTGKNNEGQYTAQCEIQTPGCDMILLLTASRPFKTE